MALRWGLWHEGNQAESVRHGCNPWLTYLVLRQAVSDPLEKIEWPADWGCAGGTFHGRLWSNYKERVVPRFLVP